MKRLIYDLRNTELVKSVSVAESNERFGPTLKPFKQKQIGERPTIVIDNGSYEAKAGWSFEDMPYLRFRNVVAKPKTSVNKNID
jgi:hypothetical protein